MFEVLMLGFYPLGIKTNPSKLKLDSLYHLRRKKIGREELKFIKKIINQLKWLKGIYTFFHRNPAYKKLSTRSSEN